LRTKLTLCLISVIEPDQQAGGNGECYIMQAIGRADVGKALHATEQELGTADRPGQQPRHSPDLREQPYSLRATKALHEGDLEREVDFRRAQ
jgi:hypothetical protein